MSFKIRLKMEYIFLFVMIMPFLRQRSEQEWPAWLVSLEAGASLIFATYFYIKVFILGRFSFSKLKKMLPIILFWVLYVVITLVFNNSKLGITGQHCYRMLAFALFINYEMERHTESIIKVLAFAYTAYTLLNNILVIIFPTGFYEIKTSDFHKGHLLGDDNAIIYVALPAMILLCIYSIYQHGRLNVFTIFNIALCEFVYLRLWAGSAMVCMALFILLLFIGLKIRQFSPYVCLGVMTGIIVIIFAGGSMPVISNFIVNVLRKDLTFSNRTIWWRHGFSLIAQKPIFGWGGYFSVGGFSLGKYFYPVHTTYLQILLDGGLVLFADFVWIMMRAFSSLKRNMSKYSVVMVSGFMGIMLSYTFEWAQLWHMMILIPIAMNVDKLIASKERKIESNDNS